MVYRIYVEKKSAYAIEAAQTEDELKNICGIAGLTKTRIIQRYDVEGIGEELFQYCIKTVFSDPVTDTVLYELPEASFICAVEFVPGQFDQRSDSAAQCIELITRNDRPIVSHAKIYLFDGTLSEQDKKNIESYLINPVETRKADLAPKETLTTVYPRPPDIEVLHGFNTLQVNELDSFIANYALAMDKDDLLFTRKYFQGEEREPTITEIRVIDTYWSDHCRHTTFSTVLENIKIEDDAVQQSYDTYLGLRKKLGITKKQTLMDIATIGAKALFSDGKLSNWDISDEVNACSIKITADHNGKNEDWLLLFKNETHNHPTEIEPFGGAATCIGGAIRDPLSGRAYVYQAMRISGAGNPLAPLDTTLAGKLPQRKIVRSAAAGYSSYGNQIGVATGLVHEFYHDGYIAKHLETGAVVGAVPFSQVRRETPRAGDIVILTGGRTGRDGCGGATGSSKAHKKESIETCGAEVQKGNAPVERKLQRLFRNPQICSLIKRANDFGAGGVAVAIGELSSGLHINLDMIPKKYEGLDGTELAISESQERMALVIEKNDAPSFIALAESENLEALIVAEVNDSKCLTMSWRGNNIVDIARDFLNSNGCEKKTSIYVENLSINTETAQHNTEKNILSLSQRFFALAGDINCCSKKGLCERFDSTIGAGTVLSPFGGKYQLTPAQIMCAKIPVEGETETCSAMAFGFDPYISEAHPYYGAYNAVISSVAKLVGAGFLRKNIFLSLQEYFPKPGSDPRRWALPFSALLGALQAQLDLGVAAIGGKDSMSGSFEDLDVPPTLISFAVATGNVNNVISGEFKKAGSKVFWLSPKTKTQKNAAPAIDEKSFIALLDYIEQHIAKNDIISTWSLERFGAAEALIKMCLGNKLGLKSEKNINADTLFLPSFGSFICEIPIEKNIVCDTDEFIMQYIGATIDEYTLYIYNTQKNDYETIDMDALQNIYEQQFESFMPSHTVREKSSSKDNIQNVMQVMYERGESSSKDSGQTVMQLAHERGEAPRSSFSIIKGARPRALIPVFPGTNCEYDTARALQRAGADPEIFVVNNLSSGQTKESAKELAARINNSNMLILPGGFSGGDEPDGSAKLICAFFRGPDVATSVMDLLEKRDGLMLGICNGFQALVKLGLVPFGKIMEIEEDFPTLTFNTLGRHQSMLVRTKLCSNLSPWFLCEDAGAIHTIPVSHGEGCFVANESFIKALSDRGQIACQYVDLDGVATMDPRYNPNGSAAAIEAVSSADGRVLGKMAHSERVGNQLYKNIPGKTFQKLFEGGVRYFS